MKIEAGGVYGSAASRWMKDCLYPFFEINEREEDINRGFMLNSRAFPCKFGDV